MDGRESGSFFSGHFLLSLTRSLLLLFLVVQKIEIACKCASLPSEHKNTIVCLVDRDERTNKLVYLNQSERVSHTVDPTFKKKFPLTFVDTSAKTLRFNVYDVVSRASGAGEASAVRQA